MSEQKDSEQGLLVGVARTTITPPVGIPLSGSLRDGPSGRVERDLTATALCLSSSETTVVIIACDLILLLPSEARLLRERIADDLRISAGSVLINTSHTHATPSPPGWGEYEEGGEDSVRELVEAYFADVNDRIAGIARNAFAARQPARHGCATGSVRIGINRREQLPDGTMVLGENLDGIVDPTVGVLRFDTLTGAPIALLLHYTCHPDVLGPKCDLISPDYVGAARAVAEGATGAPVLFLQGAAGDIDPLCGIVMGDDAIDEMNRLGSQLGCEAARVFHTINTTRERLERVAWESTASVVTGWRYTDKKRPHDPKLGAESRRVTMPLRALPPLGDAERELEEYRAAWNSVCSRHGAPSERLIARRRARWGELQLQAVREHRPAELEIEIQAIRLGDFALVTIPGEPFVEIGLQIKQRSPFRNTFVSGYSNGLFFYIPTAAAFKQGGYEVESYRNFMQPAGPTPEWAEILDREAHALLEQLCG